MKQADRNAGHSELSAADSEASGGSARRLSKRELWAALAFIVFGLGIHLVAPTLNGVKTGGLPLGYWVSAQLGPLILGLLAWWLAGRKVAS